MPSRELALLSNPTAGKGRGGKVRERVLARFRDAGAAVRDLQGRDAEEALELARTCVSDAGTDTSLGIVPAGSGNDVARHLGLPLKDPDAAVDRVLAGTTRTVDLGRSGTQYFATVLAAGFDAVVNERANRMTWPRGRMRYNLATLVELRVFEPLPYLLQLDDREVSLEAMLVAVGNGPSFGGGRSRAPTSTIPSTSITWSGRSRWRRPGSCRTPTESGSLRCP